jgi:hypothetical protein
MTELETAASACRARIANAERGLAYATEKYEAEITAQALGDATGSAAALDKRVADLRTRQEAATAWLQRERSALAGILRAIEAADQAEAARAAEAKAVALAEKLDRLDKQAAKVAGILRTAGDEFAGLISIARELGVIRNVDGVMDGGAAVLPLVHGATVDIIRNGLGSLFPNAQETLNRRNERADRGLVAAARLVRYCATGEPVDGEPVDGDDGDQAEAA